jgi:NADH-quinone oxidoreductase subunit L
MESKFFAAVPWIVYLPALGALFTGLFGKYLGERLAAAIATVAVTASFGVTLYAVWFLYGETDPSTFYVANLYTFLDTRFLDIQVAFQLDRLSAVMALVVTGISALIHLYSIGYMEGDRSATRYFSHLNMFVFFMLLLVLGKNLVMMFVGWEGVGLCSYLLIGFWYEDKAKSRAGKKAFIVNRIGDFGFLLALLMMIVYNQGSLDFGSLQEWASSGASPVMNQTNMTVICLLLFLGAAGKSAQIPLYVWLPDAMAGPTPVSALIHAATMVTAGIYMVARLSFLYVHAPMAMAVVAGIGALTALFAATIGIAQRDIKKVLAYSTISQLGFMFLAVGSGAFATGIFHLTTHAFFKACLFLGAGSVIHALQGEQDIFKMGGLSGKMPLTHGAFLISTLAIAGIPPLSGFFSKDEILTAAYLSETAWPGLYKVYWAMGLVAAFITALYMMRLYWLTFRGKTRLPEDLHRTAHESPWTMGLALAILALGAASAGFLGIPGGSHLLQSWLAPVLGTVQFPLTNVSQGLHWTLVFASVAVGIAGLVTAWLLYGRGPDGPAARLAETFGWAHRAVARKFYVDEAIDLVLVRPLRRTARFSYQVVDRVLIDLFVVNGSARAVRFLGLIPRALHNGNVQNYLLAIVIGLACLWIVL